jgi:hypothetical protein
MMTELTLDNILDRRQDTLYGRVVHDLQGEPTMQTRSNDTDRWFAAGGGIGFGVLTILGWAFWAAPEFPKLSPGIPSLSDSAASVASYYAQHATTVQIGCLLGTIALLPLLCFTVAPSSASRSSADRTVRARGARYGSATTRPDARRGSRRTCS